MTDKMNSAQFRAFWDKQEKAKHSKYKGVPKQTADGQKFQSHHEADHYTKLLLLQRSGEKFTFTRQVRYEIVVNGLFICEYVADFVVIHEDGRVEVVDTKSEGTLTPMYKLKKKLMMAVHGIEIVEVFPVEKK